MERPFKKLLIGLAGLVLGLATYYLLYGWYDLFPWGIAALIIGYTSENRRNSVINGAIFGYFLFLVYIFLGYKEKTDTGSMIHFFLFDMAFSLVGSVAGVIGAFIGNYFKKKF